MPACERDRKCKDMDPVWYRAVWATLAQPILRPYQAALGMFTGMEPIKFHKHFPNIVLKKGFLKKHWKEQMKSNPNLFQSHPEGRRPEFSHRPHTPKRPVPCASCCGWWVALAAHAGVRGCCSLGPPFPDCKETQFDGEERDVVLWCQHRHHRCQSCPSPVNKHTLGGLWDVNHVHYLSTDRHLDGCDVALWCHHHHHRCVCWYSSDSRMDACHVSDLLQRLSELFLCTIFATL